MPGKSDRSTNIQPLARGSHTKTEKFTCVSCHYRLFSHTACRIVCEHAMFRFLFYHSVDAGTVHRSKRVKCMNYGNIISFQNRYVEILELGLLLLYRRTQHGKQYTQCSLKYLLPQRRITYNDVLSLIDSTIL